MAAGEAAPEAGAEARWALARARLRPGHALPREFYCDPEIFAREQQRLQRHWHCAGHQSQIPEPGDFFTTELFGESLIIVRGADREVRALLNVCRHRGSRVCTESQAAHGAASCVRTTPGTMRSMAACAPPRAWVRTLSAPTMV